MSRAFLLPCFALVALGCGLDIEATTEADRVSVEDERIELAVGLAVGIRVVDAGDDETSRMKSQNPDVMGVGKTPGIHEYVVYGVAPGSTVLEVYIEDELEGEIEAVVVPYD